MSLQEICLGGGGLLVVALSIIEITPIKINPWSSFMKWLGRKINEDVIIGLNVVKTTQAETQKRLDTHISTDEKREADHCRARILRFNNELLRDIPHTQEEFQDALKDIDEYERYCREHEDYANGRAIHAIANIGRVYDERMKKHDFLK